MFGGVKITAADKWFSLFIRFRDRWTCQMCKRHCPRRKFNNPDLPTAKLECSHFFSRRHKATRYDERNAETLCFQCHAWVEGHQTEREDRCKQKLGEFEFNKLLVLAKTPARYLPPEKEIAALFRKKVQAMAKKKGMLWLVK